MDFGSTITLGIAHSVAARKLEYDCQIPKPGQEGKSAQIVPDPNSNFLESTVHNLPEHNSILGPYERHVKRL